MRCDTVPGAAKIPSLYHTRILAEGEAATFHDQVGYWRWEPATGLILQTVAIPRGQVAIASGHAEPDATHLILTARRGRPEPLLHRDRNTLTKVAEPAPNPLLKPP